MLYVPRPFGKSSSPLHSAPLEPLAPRDASSPVPPAVTPGVVSGSEPDSDPINSGSASFSPSCAAAFSLADFQSMPVYSHHLRGTRVPRHLSATSQRPRIGLVAINCATVFYLRRIDVLTLTTPASFKAPARDEYNHFSSLPQRGCLPI